MKPVDRLRLPALVVAVTLAGFTVAHAQGSSSSSAASSSSGSGHSSASSSDGKTTTSTDEKGCRVIRQSEAGRNPSSTITTHPDGTVSGSTSAGSSGATASAGGGRVSSDCVVVKPDEPKGGER